MNPQRLGEISLRSAFLVKVLPQPLFASLRVTLRYVPKRADRVFGSDEELGWSERADEDDATIRLEREGVWSGGVDF